MADEFKIVASLNIPESASRINKDIPKLEGQAKHLKIVADLNPTLSIKNIQATLNKMNNNANIKIGIDTNGINSTLSDVQNKVIATNKGLSIKPTVDGKVIEDTDVLIKTIVSKLQTLNTVDLKTFKDNLKNIIGVSSKEISADADTLIQTLKLNPEDSSAIIQSYEFLMDSIRNTMSSMGKDKIVSGSSFDNNIATSIYKAATSFKEVQTQAYQTANIITNANNQVANSARTISTQYRTEFGVVTDVIKQAETEFSRFGEASAVSNKSVKALDGVPEHFRDFTIQVKSATGEVQKFFYTFENVGDNKNPVFKYMLQNINEADAGVKRLIESQQKAQDKVKALRTSLTADLKSVRSAWEDVNGGKSVKSDENIERLKQQYVKVTQAIRELRNTDDTTLASMKANADAQIDKLNQMVTQYHNAEKVATQLRAKGFETVKVDTGNNIDKFINSINNSKVPIQAMQTEINKLTSDFAQLDTIQDQAGKSASLTNILNTLDNAKTKFQSLKELFKGFGNADWLSVNSEQINKINDMATKIAIYKNNLTATRDEWKSQGIYVGEIQAKVTSLARSLPNIKKPEKFNEWVQEWNDINQKANQLKVNLDSQVATHNKIYEIQSQIAKLNPTKDTAEIARLNEKLSAEQKTLSNLQMQSNVYSNLVSLEQQEQYITEQTVKSRDKLLSATNTGVKQYQTTITNAITELQGIANSAVFSKNASNPAVAQTKQDINSLITAYQNLATKLQGNITPAGLETARTELTQLNAHFNDATTTAKRFETELRNDNGAEQLAQKVTLLTQRIKAYRQANSKSEKKFGSQYDSMLSQLANPNIDLNAYNAINKQFQIMRQEINATNAAGKTLWQTLKEKAGKFVGWMSLTGIISSIWREMKQMVTKVIELDSAMTNLKKVTDETDATYSRFLKNTSSLAKELKMDLSDLVNQTAEWAKKGYSIAESSAASKASGIYSVVGEVDNATAVQDLTTVIKSYNMAVEDSIDIVDRFNNISNKYSVTASDIGTMLSNSISSLSIAGNSLDEAIAMGTTITEITGDASEAGNTLKVLSMRLRGASTEIENAGESTDGMAESTSKLREKILALTNVTGNGGFDIMADADNFKSTYEIMKGISEVWNDISDVNQAKDCLYVQKCA